MEPAATRSPVPSAEAPRGLPIKRRAIMDAGLRIFVRDGYASSTLDDIASEANVSKQTVYNHFGDKESLFLAVVEAALQRAIAELRDATDAFPTHSSDITVDLVKFACDVVNCFLNPETTALRQLVVGEVHSYPELIAAWRQGSARTRSMLAGQFARLAHSGQLEIDDPDLAVRQFLTLITAPAWEMSELGIVPTEDELQQTIADNVKLFLRAYRRALV